MRSNFNNSKFKAGRREKPFLFQEMELISFAKRFGKCHEQNAIIKIYWLQKAKTRKPTLTKIALMQT